MALLPKNEKAIREAIAKIVMAKTSMKVKIAENIRLKSKAQTFRQNGLLQNVAIESEQMVFWLNVWGKATEDYSAFELAIIESKDNAYNRLEIQSVRESQPDADYVRTYEIKVI